MHEKICASLRGLMSRDAEMLHGCVIGSKQMCTFPNTFYSLAYPIVKNCVDCLVWSGMELFNEVSNFIVEQCIAGGKLASPKWFHESVKPYEWRAG